MGKSQAGKSLSAYGGHTYTQRRLDWLQFNNNDWRPIGDGAIIATNKTDIKNGEPYLIVREPLQWKSKTTYRGKIEALLQLRWWNWEIDIITNNLQHLTDNNNDKLIPKM